MGLRILDIDGYDFDDVLLVPTITDLPSRSVIDLSREFVNQRYGLSMQLGLPVFSAPMKGIITPELAILMGEYGACGILSRFYFSTDERKREIDQVAAGTTNFGVAFGLPDKSEEEMSMIRYALSKGAKIICVDIANGGFGRLHEALADIQEMVHAEGAFLMSGNVIDSNGVAALHRAGVDFVRVGIGGGSLCTTRNQTGVGVPQLTAVSLAAEFSGEDQQPYIVSDGGIRNAGDAMKAFAAGADAVMLGGLLANTFESGHEGEINGMASRKHQERFYGKVVSDEGLSKRAEKQIGAVDFLEGFSNNLRSGCMYLNSAELGSVQKHARFIRAGRGSIKQL